jgi:hypothetical protein
MSDERTAPARAVAVREWTLGIVLLLIAGHPLIGLITMALDLPLGHVPSVTYRLLLGAAGCCVRPIGLGATVATVSLGWLCLDLLAWTGVFDVYAAASGGSSFIYFQF